MPQFIESLEDRSLFSVTLTPAVSATILADQVAVANAKLTVKTTQNTAKATLAADRKAIPATRKAGLTAVRDARAQIVLDRGNPGQVAVDQQNLRLAIQTAATNNFNAAHQVIIDSAAGRKAVIQARGQLALAQRQLRADIVAHK